MGLCQLGNCSDRNLFLGKLFSWEFVSLEIVQSGICQSISYMLLLLFVVIINWEEEKKGHWSQEFFLALRPVLPFDTQGHPRKSLKGPICLGLRRRRSQNLFFPLQSRFACDKNCKILRLHNKAYTFGMKILGHTGLTIVLLWGDVLCRLALILSWVWIDASARHYQVVNED